MKILISPGHRNNQNDFGASGNGLKESALALSISKKLKLELEKHNVVVYMSRESEEECPSLPQRTKKANNLNVNLYLSVHINSASNKDATGIEVLYYDEQAFAQDMSNRMCNYTGAKNRGAKKRTDLHVLNATTMPALLVECGFISNAGEAKLLADNNYQDKLVKGIVEAIISKYKIVVSNKDYYKEAVTKLAQEFDINDTSWYPEPNPKNVTALVQKIGRKWYQTNEYKFIIQRMYQDKIISNTELWLAHEYNTGHIKSLIKKIAARL